MHRMYLVALAVAALTACARLTPEQQVVADAAEALGGRDRVLAVKTLVIEGEGTNGNLGQDMTPSATSEVFNVTGYRRAVDLAGRRARIVQTRTPNFDFFQGRAPQTQEFAVDGEVAYNIGANGTATRASNAVAKDRRAEFYHHPFTIVRAALDPAAKLTNPRTLGNERIVEIATADGLALTLAIDNASHLPTRVVSMTANTNLGDVAIETSFSDYKDVGGLKLPATLTTKTDRYTTAALRVTKQSADADVGDLAAPASAASAAPITGPAPANVTVEEVEKGVWLLAGQSHNTVAVEFADHVVLYEAPQNETRMLAVIAKARELRPDKPVTHVINSHHHFDHSGGIRAAVSEGLTIITQTANAAFYQEATARAHTIVPDALAKNPKPLKLETVDEELVLKDNTRTVNVYRIAGSGHADTLLIAYLPKERLLIEADLFNPGGAPVPYGPNLIENIKRLNLKVDRIVPVHGKVVPLSELVKTAAITSTN